MYNLEETSVPPQDEIAEQGLLDLFYGMIVSPIRTTRFIRTKKPLVLAFLVAIVFSIVAAIPNYFIAAIKVPAIISGTGITSGQSQSQAFFLLILIMTPVVVTISLLFSALVYQSIASILKDSGNFKGLLSVFGFNYVPIIFLVPLSLILLTKSMVGTLLYAVGSICIQVWVWYLNIIAIRENYELSTGKAVLTFILPLAVFATVIVILIVILVAILAGAISQATLN